ncbi:MULTISPECIES: zinc-binding dehydrogenase [Aneurinibacillus]|jgi:threonine dehydrogenase-like Zn-dependent dehydrogenase|uniref:Sorbitol dehydrogenase n=1 Tax=Aneurinibacillus danicus TaxID=267746 RepID=A0A511V743_9BACL|nr:MULTISPECIES: zinc-binding dehydrogenase [Aneurinibacillus]GEN34776.1 sorbitol dehydrogenase [Aneurinibacillus danicus]
MALFSKAAVLNGIEGEFTIEEYKVPEPKRGEFILRTEAAGVCGTDVHIYYGHLNTVEYPTIMGHEFCGIIEKLGADVTEDSNGRPVKEGDRVVIVPGVSCNECYYCKILKTPTRCANIRAYGFMPNDENNRLSGGFGQYVHIQYQGTSFFKTELDPHIAVLTEPLSICIHGFQRAGGVRFGSTVLVQGTGAIGLGAIAFAKRSGAAKVIAVGGPKRRLQLAREMGADIVIDIEDVRDPAERIKLVKSETKGGRGPDMVVECTGFPSSVPEGLAYLRDSGSYVELGHFTDVGSAEINPHWHMLRNNADIHGVWGSDVEHMEMTLNILERMELPYEKLVTHQLALDRVEDAILAMSKKAYKLDDKEEIIKATIDPWEALAKGTVVKDKYSLA